MRSGGPTDRRPATSDRPTDDRRPHFWENFKWQYLRRGSSDLVRVPLFLHFSTYLGQRM